MGSDLRLDIGAVRIREDATVHVLCRQGAMIPRHVQLGAMAYPITNILRTWEGRHHNERLFYFLVSSGDVALKLCFLSHDCAWMVEEMAGPAAMAIPNIPTP